MNLKKTLFMVLVAVVSILGITSVKALTINDDGKYTLILTSSEENATIDGENQKIIKFNVAEGETTVKLSELTNGVVPFNGRTEFSHWGSFTGEKVNDVIALTEFKWSGDLADQSYTNGLTFYASFSDKIFQGKENVKIFLKENPVLRDELEQKIREHYGFIEKTKDKKEK